MPRGRRRGRRARRNTRPTARPRPSEQQNTNIPAKENDHQRNKQMGRSPCSRENVELLSNHGRATGMNNNSSNGYTGLNKTTANLSDTDSKKTENPTEISPSTSKYCHRYYKSCKCLANTSKDSSNISEMSKSGSMQERKSSKLSVQNSVQNQDFASFSLVKKTKTPYGKVKIYSTGKLDVAEDERIMREAVKLLIYVEGCTKPEQKCKKPKSDSFVVRVRKFFGK